MVLYLAFNQIGQCAQFLKDTNTYFYPKWTKNDTHLVSAYSLHGIILHFCDFILMVVLLSTLQIQRITENVSDCSIPSPSIRPLQYSMPVSETPKKKNQEQSLVEDKHITSKAMSPDHIRAAKSHTPPHFPKIDVSLRRNTQSLIRLYILT